MPSHGSKATGDPVPIRGSGFLETQLGSVQPVPSSMQSKLRHCWVLNCLAKLTHPEIGFLKECSSPKCDTLSPPACHECAYIGPGHLLSLSPWGHAHLAPYPSLQGPALVPSPTPSKGFSALTPMSSQPTVNHWARQRQFCSYFTDEKSGCPARVPTLEESSSSGGG